MIINLGFNIRGIWLKTKIKSLNHPTDIFMIHPKDIFMSLNYRLALNSMHVINLDSREIIKSRSYSEWNNHLEQARDYLLNEPEISMEELIEFNFTGYLKGLDPFENM